MAGIVSLDQRRGYGNIKRGKKDQLNPLYILIGIIGTILVVILTFIIIGSYDTYSNNKQSESSSLLLLTNNDDNDNNNNVVISKNNANTNNNKPIVIAYVISLIKCGDMHSSTEGMSDAAMVLRHSVHLQSIRANNGISKYDYKMYAIVHKDAEKCSQTLVDSGFHILVRDVPITKDEIQDEYLKKHIKHALCCGHDEFIKLYAYTMIEYPIVVHVDVDFTFHKPMDDLYDAMIYEYNSIEGIAARKRIPLERPNTTILPNRIDAYMTRDWPQVMPGRKPAYQAGLLIIRPDMDVFYTILNVIKTTKFISGFGRDNGWNGKGYGAMVGDMAMQGLLAYVYDEILTDNWVELNQCRFNHMGVDVLFRNSPGFQPKHPKVGKCRNDLDYCEDCQYTNMTDVYNIHYTLCRKPWNCIGEKSSEYPNYKSKAIPEGQVRYEHCMIMLNEWHTIRTDLENQLYTLTNDITIKNGQLGKYKTNVFQGHCNENSQSGYIQMSAKQESIQRIPELYN